MSVLNFFCYIRGAAPTTTSTKSILLKLSCSIFAPLTDLASAAFRYQPSWFLILMFYELIQPIKASKNLPDFPNKSKRKHENTKFHSKMSFRTTLQYNTREFYTFCIEHTQKHVSYRFSIPFINFSLICATYRTEKYSLGAGQC